MVKVLGIAVLVFSLALVSITLAPVAQAGPPPTATLQIQFTKDGQPTGDPVTVPNGNGFDIDFDLANGVILGGVVTFLGFPVAFFNAPDGANDLRGDVSGTLNFNSLEVPESHSICLQYTEDGNDIGPLQCAPAGANDLHVEYGFDVLGNPVFTPGAFWTQNGVPIGDPIVVPIGANDITVVIREPPRAVGGEMLPIDTTSLFIAGAFTNAYWILPMIAGIAGSVVALRRIGRRKFKQD